MMNDRSYRLNNYRIIVYDDVLVRWEHHAPLGMARSGRCYFFGDVLIIGQKSSDEDGFLIGEFLDSLKKMPPWVRTRYYCFAGELLDTATGQGLVDETVERFSSLASRFAHTHAEVARPGAYRLGNYRITVEADHAILWQAYGDLNRIIGGSCSVESNILIIGQREHDEQGEGKHGFFDTLDRLPQWDGTMVWCRGPVLRPCQDIQRNEKRGLLEQLRATEQDGPAEGKGHHSLKESGESRIDPSPLLESVGRFVITAKTFLLSGAHVIKNAWQRIPAARGGLAGYVLLVAAIVLLGVTAAFSILKKDFPGFGSHGFTKHHHKHHDHDR
jgi:hypothetical protein